MLSAWIHGMCWWKLLRLWKTQVHTFYFPWEQMDYSEYNVGIKALSWGQGKATVVLRLPLRVVGFQGMVITIFFNVPCSNGNVGVGWQFVSTATCPEWLCTDFSKINHCVYTFEFMGVLSRVFQGFWSYVW